MWKTCCATVEPLGASFSTADRRIKRHIDGHGITHNGVILVSNPATLKRNPDDAVRRLLNFDARMADTTDHLSYLSDWTPR